MIVTSKAIEFLQSPLNNTSQPHLTSPQPPFTEASPTDLHPLLSEYTDSSIPSWPGERKGPAYLAFLQRGAQDFNLLAERLWPITEELMESTSEV
jgi:hypothetical protein